MLQNVMNKGFVAGKSFCTVYYWIILLLSIVFYTFKSIPLHASQDREQLIFYLELPDIQTGALPTKPIHEVLVHNKLLNI